MALDGKYGSDLQVCTPHQTDEVRVDCQSNCDFAFEAWLSKTGV